MDTTKPGIRVVFWARKIRWSEKRYRLREGREWRPHPDWNRVGEEAASAVGQDAERGKAMSAHCREDKRQPARGGCLVPDEP